jgi:hypothetical protein
MLVDSSVRSLPLRPGCKRSLAMDEHHKASNDHFCLNSYGRVHVAPDSEGDAGARMRNRPAYVDNSRPLHKDIK